MSELKRLLGWMGRGIATAALIGCASAPAKQPEPRPALWKLADQDTTIYLFGTIHALPEGTQWRSPALDQAIAASDTLVLETKVDLDVNAAGAAMAQMGIGENLPPIAERVPAEKREALKKAIAAAGIPEAVLDRLETWAAGFALLSASFQKMGLQGEKGVERSLLPGFNTEGKKVEWLESLEQQLGLFDTLSEDAQRAFLVSVLDDEAAAKGEFNGMLSAWESGDVAKIAETFDSETALSPELRRALMTNRNAAWADWLKRRLDQPGTVMVAVGAGHLAGNDSVQRMLEGRGLKVQRVQ